MKIWILRFLATAVLSILSLIFILAIFRLSPFSPCFGFGDYFLGDRPRSPVPCNIIAFVQLILFILVIIVSILVSFKLIKQKKNV